MTPLRQGLNAAFVVAGLCVATPTFAQPLALVGPPTAEEAATAAAAASAAASAAATAAAAAAPKAAGKVPTWLAARPQPKVTATGKSAMPSAGRMIGLLLVVGSLGGAALYLKRRGKVDATREVGKQRLSVVSSTRIGPKAHAVVISVAGRQMLLGVTDSSVKRLAFIDEVEDEEREREPARRPSPATRGAAIAVREMAPQAAKAGSFADLLKTAFGKRAPVQASDAASILAAETVDTVGGKPAQASASNVRLVDVEGQAQGLVRRLSGPRA